MAVLNAHYNPYRIRRTLGVTPAMEAGLADHAWSLNELVGLWSWLGGVMKIKAVLESIAVGVILAILSYRELKVPAYLAAVALRRKMPDAWFSGLITWYVLIVVIGISMVLAGVACRMVYKHVAGSTPRA